MHFERCCRAVETADPSAARDERGRAAFALISIGAARSRKVKRRLSYVATKLLCVARIAEGLRAVVSKP